MVPFKRRDLDVTYLRSLAWHGDCAIDLLDGGTRYHPDGTIEEPRVHRGFAYKFDSVVSSGNHAVLHEKYGTKGLLVSMEPLDVVRELNRSYYHAEDYAYPIAMFDLPDGRGAVAHCHKEYCSLDIETVEGGEVLTERTYNSSDIFHSKLDVSADGRYLVENGWVWHPWNVVQAYDIRRALKEPGHLDGDGIAVPQGGSLGWEPESVTMCGHHVVTASVVESGDGDPMEGEDEYEIKPAEKGIPESVAPGDDSRVRRVASSELSIVDGQGNPIDLGVKAKRPPGLHYLLQAYDLDGGHITSSRLMPDLVGRMMPVGSRHVVSFYDHPKLIEVATGKVVARWEDLFAGPEQGQPSAMMRPPTLPTLACDPAHKRFAVGTEKRVTFVELGDLDG
ncbi:MAG: hypothetical protein JW839_19760 [Candidatus Lokiarchaeota archaeon]|nr:hypothetical protein [Candidatus Lokiarchaeota archaeon]